MAPETEHDDLFEIKIPSMVRIIAFLASSVLVLSLVIPWGINHFQEKQTADIVPPPPPVASSAYGPTYNEYIQHLQKQEH